MNQKGQTGGAAGQQTRVSKQDQAQGHKQGAGEQRLHVLMGPMAGGFLRGECFGRVGNRSNRHRQTGR